MQTDEFYVTCVFSILKIITYKKQSFTLNILLLGKDSKKNQLWKIPYRVLTPPPGYGNFFYFFFLKLDHFLRTFCKKCIFTFENPKKIRKFFKK